jgi:hypothetical protein
MADLQTALRSRLISDSGVSAVTARIYWGIVPQGAALPYVRLNTISDPRPEHLQGYDAARQTRVQADCFASTYGTARGLAEKIIAAVAQPATTAGVRFGRTKAEGPRDLGEDTDSGSFTQRASLDLLVEHSLA